MEDALEHGAAVLGVPVKPTIKEVDSKMMVERTLVRSKLWDVQTPQVCASSVTRHPACASSLPHVHDYQSRCNVNRKRKW